MKFDKLIEYLLEQNIVDVVDDKAASTPSPTPQKPITPREVSTPYKNPNPPQQSVTPSKTGGYVIPFAFPGYEPKIQGNTTWDKFLGGLVNKLASGTQEGTYGKLGHGGVVVVGMNGIGSLFEFGRYQRAKRGYGLTLYKNVPLKAQMVPNNVSLINKVGTVYGSFSKEFNPLNPHKDPLNVGKAVKSTLQPHFNYKIGNLSSFMKAAKSVCKPPGNKMSMTYVAIPAPQVDRGLAFARATVGKNNQTKYRIFDFSLDDDDANCGTFAANVVKESGVPIPDFCNPAPIGMIMDLMPFGFPGQI